MTSSTTKEIKAFCIATLCAAGRGQVRRHLESLVNRGRITLAEANEVWGGVFGGRLIAVPTRTIEVSL